VRLEELVRRFGASRAEPVTMGHSGASVIRLERGSEVLYWKSAAGGVDDEADRLTWLATTDVPCPRVVDRGNGWMLTTAMAGRDAAQPWPAADRPAVLTAMVEGLRRMHALDAISCSFVSPFPVGPGPAVVTHGDYCCPNVLVDPETLRFTGVLDVGRLGVGDPYADLSMAMMMLAGDLNAQYGGLPAAREVITTYGGDPEDPRIDHYIALDQSGSLER